MSNEQYNWRENVGEPVDSKYNQHIYKRIQVAQFNAKKALEEVE